jgi:hypothetical protein
MDRSLIYLDRYRNEGTRTYSEHAGYTEAQEQYRPNSRHSAFKLAVFEVPGDQMLTYTANPSSTLVEKYLGGDRVLFCIHPQVLETHWDEPYVEQTLSIGTPREDIAVSPSSSTRTLYVQDAEEPHAVKVHFPFRISRYGRKMRNEVLEQAINISRELEAGLHQLDGKFSFLREVIGVAHKNLDPESPRGENWGYLIRDMTPYPPVGQRRDLIPGFALYGRDYFDPDAHLLLFDLIGDRDPLAFVLESIMLPIIRHWVSCFRHFGFLLEPHGQNVLFEVGGGNEIERIIHRDLSLGIDMRRRRDIALSDENLNDYNRMKSNEFLSITYDKFMGGHFFDRIVSACQGRCPGLKKEDFTEPCQQEFAQIFPEHPTYFPKTVQYFSEERDQFNKPLYQDTGRVPEWRP